MENQKEKFEWAQTHFSRFVDDVKRTSLLARMSIEGITVLHQMPDMLEKISHLHGVTVEDPAVKSVFEDLKRGAELAKKEVDENFPLIHAQYIVAIWTLLEEIIRAFVASLIRNEPYATQKACVRDLKIEFGEYEEREGDDRYFYIVGLLEQKYSAGIRNGVDRFETLLKLFDFSGDIPDKLRKAIFEWGQVRNCIVHRAGTTDSQLLKACPWLSFKSGEKMTVSLEMSTKYQRACLTYVAILLDRIAIKCDKKSTLKNYPELMTDWI